MSFKLLLGVVMALFLGILVAAYAAARYASPVLLDERGHPITVGR